VADEQPNPTLEAKPDSHPTPDKAESSSPVTNEQILAAKDARARFHRAQSWKKLGAAIVGMSAATLGVAAPTSTVSKIPPTLSAPAFPEFIVNGTCGMEGGKRNGKQADEEDRKRNVLKNRFDVPDEGAIDHAITIDDFLSTDEDAVKANSTVLNQDRAARISAYVVSIEPGGSETCNCQTTDKSFWDTHIYLSKDDPTKRPPHKKGDPSPTQKDMIVEITPRMRQIVTPGSDEWTTSKLRKAFPKGTRVTVTGWQFYDGEHEKDAFVIKHAARDWRYSCWEIHPVTDIQKAE
jgi:hypothetical protein